MSCEAFPCPHRAPHQPRSPCMATIGYHASHEQFPPSALLRYVKLAEEAGFTGGMCSDHFAPWSERQNESGFSFAWLGAALHATKLPFGTVCAPGQRYHPAIVAQAAATLAEMNPGRFWLALGSGQAMNEHITGERWPPKHERMDRLRECVDVIRALWDGETVTYRGLIQVDEAKLWTRPEEPPMLVGAAISPETAEWVGGWADALITIAKPREEMEETVAAFRRGGGEGKPMYLQAQLSWAESDEEARSQAHDQWRNNILPPGVQTRLHMPADFDAVGDYVEEEDLEEHIRMSADVDDHIEWIRKDVEMGFSGIYLHNVGPNQEAFIETFGEKVLPELR
jgi:coenzyme F420-dependent glucose-6-phosphate dehydrogenase